MRARSPPGSSSRNRSPGDTGRLSSDSESTLNHYSSEQPSDRGASGGSLTKGGPKRPGGSRKAHSPHSPNSRNVGWFGAPVDDGPGSSSRSRHGKMPGNKRLERQMTSMFGSGWSNRRKGGGSTPPGVESSGRHGVRVANTAAKLMMNLGETVTTVVISRDKRLFAAGAINKRAIVCDLANGDLVAEFTADGQITASVFGLSGRFARLILGTFNGMIVVYHIASNRQEHCEKFGNGEMVTCMAIDRSSTRLAVAGKSTKILLYALSLTEEAIGMNVLHTIDCGTTTTLSVSIDSVCQKLVAGGESRVVSMWDIPIESQPPEPSMFDLPKPRRNSQRTSVKGAHDAQQKGVGKPLQFRTTSTIHSVALTSNGDTLAVGTSDHTEIYRVGLSADSFSEDDDDFAYFCEPLLVLDCPATQGGVAFSSHSQLAIGGNQLVHVFDLQTGGMVAKLEREDRVRCVSLSDDGKILLMGGFDKKVLLHQLHRGANFYDFCIDLGSVAKSVHLSESSSLLAMGLEIGGEGKVVLFDTDTSSLKSEWNHSKAVWCVRFSPDAEVLAAGGWDMKLTLYSTSSYQQLQQIAYQPLGGPAFIWSLEWSADQRRLALGCWNCNTYLYSFNASGTAGAGAGTPPLAEICRVKRSDRAYAVSLDQTGGYMVVGGRDKRVAMYDTDRGEELDVKKVDAVPMWDVLSDDFVYCVALSLDMQYVAFGGTAKKVCVLSALSGTALFEVAQSGVIWSVALLHSAKGWKLAIGGELPVVTVMQIETQEDELQLPVSETVFDICMRNDSIALCNGSRSTMFGAGGTHFSWQEKPSFQVVSGIVMSLLTAEEQLVRSMQLIIDRHPAVVNSCDEFGSGGSLLHFIIDRTNQPELLSRLLNVKCRLALQRDRQKRSPIQLAVQTGKWRSMQLLLDALIRERFSMIPKPMSIVNANLREMAHKYPLDFLSFISKTELQMEPEVLGEFDASDVMLPERLLLGSDLRCPKGAWNRILSAFRVSRIVEDEEDEDEYEPSVSKGGSLRRGSQPPLALTEVANIKFIQDEAKQDDPSTRQVEIGFSRSLQTGVQAFRVPLEDFAALAESGGTCALQLIIEAVSRSTRGEGYTAFGSTLVDILLEFKWRGFARRKFYVELMLYLTHVVIILVWNIESQKVLNQGYSFPTMREELAALHPTFVVLAALWIWTTLMCVIFTRVQVFALMSIGCSYWYDPWKVLELCYVVCQLSVNVLFLTHHLIPDSVFRTGWTDGYNDTLVDLFSRRLTGVDLPWEDEYSAGFWNEGGVQATPPVGRLLRGGGGAGGGGGGGAGGAEGGTGTEEGRLAAAMALYPYGTPTGKRPGPYIILQALVALLTWVRLLYYFKGILRLGTLVHTMQRIFVDIYPLLMLMIVIFIAFWSSMWLLIQVELEADFSKEWHDLWGSIVKMINMGLYTDIDPKVASKERDKFVSILYEVYMFVVQIILLNMLIALMAESNERVRAIAKLVAQYERAKLILQWERRLSGLSTHTSIRTRTFRFFSGLPTGVGRTATQHIFPKWIHVLMPADKQTGGDDGADPAALALKVANEALTHAQEGYAKMAKAVATSQEETKRLASLVVDTQEKHGNMLRDLRSDFVVAKSTGGVGIFSAAPPAQLRRRNTTNMRTSNTSSLRPSKEAMGTAAELTEAAVSTVPDEGGKASGEGAFGWLGGIFSPLSSTDSNAIEEPAATQQPATEIKEVPPRTESPAGVRASKDKAREEGRATVSITTAEQTPKDRTPAKEPSALPKERPLPKDTSPVVTDLNVQSMKKMMANRDDIPIPSMIERPTSDPKDPSAALRQVQKECQPADVQRARKIAVSLRHPEYSLKDFHSDVVAAFPELRYYMVETAAMHARRKKAAPPKPVQAAVNLALPSTCELEYLRTMGAFFAIYWLARIGIDGERGFSFGVDELSPTWAPMDEKDVSSSSAAHSKPSMPLRKGAICGASVAGRPAKRLMKSSLKDPDDHASSAAKLAKMGPLGMHAGFFTMSAPERASAFFQNTQWQKLAENLVDAGLLERNTKAQLSSPEAYTVCVDRMVGLLVLTAIKDIMKIDSLLPHVQREHGGYAGLSAGDRINDHSVALGYILEHYSDAVPSFAQLPKDLQHTLQFTQVKLAFNHGWLVQAEAPPGPLFKYLKHTLKTDKKIRSSDVAFYFVHWLVDLAGAEPTPLKGSEKFVLKFPHAILHSFISSFSIVGSLVSKTETQVFETFLNYKWAEVAKDLGTPPTGPGAIALMRLVTQVQHLPLQQRLVSAWPQLDPDDQKVLAFEMSLTGVSDQSFERVASQMGGPSILVYYSPAFMRVASRTDAKTGMRFLADIYRQARSMWPFSAAEAHNYITIRIDQIKDQTPQHIMDGYMWGEGWLLVKQNNREAVIEHHPLYTLSQAGTSLGSDFRLLRFWKPEEEGDEEGTGDFIQELEYLRAQRMVEPTERVRPREDSGQNGTATDRGDARGTSLSA